MKTITLASEAEFDVTPLAALEAYLRGSAATADSYLVLDLRRDPGDDALSPLLRSLPLPVLALVPEEPRGLLQASCDVTVSDPTALASVVANIRHAPLAASVLVQTLRATAAMSPFDALTVESLAYATLQAGPEFARWLAARETPKGPPKEFGPAVLLAREGTALSVTLNRPENRNAISVEMRDALFEAFELTALDEDIASLRVTGRGDCFSVGGDLSEFGTAPNPAEAHMIRMQRLPARALLPVASRTEFHVQGACIGAGAELPAFAARLTATVCTFFQLPELRFGLIPGAGGCVSIPRRIGRQRTAYMALSGRRINAKTALAWGLIDAITN